MPVRAGLWMLVALLTLAYVARLVAAADDTVDKKPPTARTAIDTSGFRDGTHHWRKIRDDSRVIKAVADQPSYDPKQVDEIVANILLFQRANGGWPKDYDMLAVLTDEQKEILRATHDKTDTSFDNYNIHSQVDYLAQAAESNGETTWRDACRRGFDYILASQLANGGWPQRYPNATGYAAHITFNDGVMIGNLNVLKDAADNASWWGWLDDERRAKAKQAVDRGIDCILKCQIVHESRPTGWCQQHDEKNFEPASARTFELASTCPQETTAIVRFLMRVERPGPEVQLAIDQAVGWLQRVQLQKIRVDRVPAPVVEFERHRADFDSVVVEDPQAPPLWARHYEIGSNRPVFAGRDAVKRYALKEIERERRTGTPWYGKWPEPLLEREYPAWREKLSAAAQADKK